MRATITEIKQTKQVESENQQENYATDKTACEKVATAGTKNITKNIHFGF